MLKFGFDSKLRGYDLVKLQKIDLGLGEAIRHMTLIGEGISRLSDFMVRKDIDEGKLIPLLESFDAEEYQQIYLLFPHPSNVTARLKVLIEFLVESFNNQRTWN